MGGLHQRGWLGRTWKLRPGDGDDQKGPAQPWRCSGEERSVVLPSLSTARARRACPIEKQTQQVDGPGQRVRCGRTEMQLKREAGATSHRASLAAVSREN